MTTSSVSATSPFAEFVGTLALIGLAALLAAGWALVRALRGRRRRRDDAAHAVVRSVRGRYSSGDLPRDEAKRLIRDALGLGPTPADNRRAS